jgi:hypothetical protein
VAIAIPVEGRIPGPLCLTRGKDLAPLPQRLI